MQDDKSSLEYQQQIRSESCYGFVRRVISMLTGLSIAFSVMYVLVSFATLASHGSLGGNAFLFLIAVLGIGLAIVSNLAAKHFIFAILDIADAAIEHNRRKHS